MGDWLGTEKIANRYREFLPFREARTYARSLGLKSGAEWSRYCKSGTKPDDIPASPQKAYKNEGWIGMGDWLGTGNKKGGWRPFNEAREFGCGLGLKSRKEWTEYVKTGDKPEDIPADPPSVYKDKGWKGYPDWLGTNKKKS